jgi:hypothetical protein
MVMAKIYVNCGNYDEAINELDYVLSLRAVNTVNGLKLQSWVDPLRDHPRFQALLEKYNDNGLR